MGGASDLDQHIATLRRCEIIPEDAVVALCAKARELLIQESNVQHVDSPVTVRAGGWSMVHLALPRAFARCCPPLLCLARCICLPEKFVHDGL
eukprot:m.16560 g.16560  ORF g.16560 m.16560 type:complete len:93 (-) comp5277_c0_seq2:1144-1422(-)